MKSPYQQYLGTNYTPTIDETRNIRRIIENSAKEILELDPQIDKLQKQLVLLQEKRAETQSFSDQHKALLSPMRQLTQDILGEIFLACLSTDRNPCMSAAEAPLLLTRVCSSWRQVAFCTPRIWAKIHIPLPFVTLGDNAGEKELIEQEEHVHRILELRKIIVKEWLGRSYTCPLSISVYQTRGFANYWMVQPFEASCEKMRAVHLSFILDTIVPHQKRWRDLDICLADITLRGLLDAGLKAESLEMLETFHVTRQKSNLPGRSPEELHLFEWRDIVSLMTSRIKSATFNRFPILKHEIASVSRDVWRNLTELYLQKVNNEQSNTFLFAASILPHCHSLITLQMELDLRSSWSSDTFNLLPDTILLPHLTNFSIMLPVSSAGLAFAKAIYLPSLKNLELYFDLIQQNDVSAQEVLELLLRASEGCHTLKVYNPNWATSHSDLVQALKLTPLLRCLKVSEIMNNNDRWSVPYIIHGQRHYGKVINDIFLQILTPTSWNTDQDIICPRLEEVEVDKFFSTSITEACLKEFLMSRKNDQRVSALRRISLFIDHPKSKKSSNADQISLGSDSAIYFKKAECYTPFDGFHGHHSENLSLPSDIYNEL